MDNAQLNILNMIGLAKRAGRIEIGEEPVGAAARARYAKILLIAADAAENSYRRIAHFADAGNCIWLSVPFSKDELGNAVGRSSCAMIAITDIGFASSIVQKLSATDPEKYGDSAEQLGAKAKKTMQRKKEKIAHEKNLKAGVKRGRKNGDNKNIKI